MPSLGWTFWPAWREAETVFEWWRHPGLNRLIAEMPDPLRLIAWSLQLAFIAVGKHV